MNEVHPARLASEAEIQAAMKQLNEEQRKRLVPLLGVPPRLENVPQSFWDQVEDEQAAVLLLLIASISDRSARHMRSSFQSTGLYVPDSVIEERVSGYAVNRASEVAGGVTETVKNRLQNYFERIKQETPTDTRPPRVTEQDLSEVLGDDQAETVAQTETTAANSYGEGIVRDDAKANGKEVVVVWRTEGDAKVCPVCSPLHNSPEESWVRKFPLGPPAHPRCRCDLETIIDGVSAGTFLPDIGINPVGR